MPVCRTQEPPLRTTAAGHQVACHLTENRYGSEAGPK
jgi:hypothetical protein